MVRAAIYTRYSTDKQHHSSTLTQIDVCVKYCDQRDYKVVKIYSDEALTGTNTKRKAFEELNRDAHLNLFDVVIIYELGRSNRDVADWFIFRKEMREQGIKVESASEQLGDTLDPSAFLYEGIKAVVVQHQALETRKKSIDTKILLARSGVFLGGVPPLGYDVVNQKYVINKKEAEAVRLIFKMYDEGYSKIEIVRAVDELGVCGKRGSKIKLPAIYDILRNKRYIGTYSWMKFKTREMHKSVGKVLTDYGTEIEDAIPAIIEKDLFWRVQRKMESRKLGNVDYEQHAKNQYMLSGKLFCKKCGARLYGRTAKNTRGVVTIQYVCPNHYYKKTCSQPNLPAIDVEDTVMFKLAEWLKSINSSDAASLLAKKLTGIKPDSSLNKKLAKVKKEQKAIIDAIKKGLYQDSMKQEMRALEIEEREIKEQILEQKFPQIKVGAAIESIIDKIEADVKNITPENMKTLVDHYVLEVRANDNELEMDFGVNAKKSKKKCLELISKHLNPEEIGNPAVLLPEALAPRTQFLRLHTTKVRIYLNRGRKFKKNLK